MAGDIDFHGYSRERVGQYLYSSDYAMVMFANSAGGATASAKKAGLVQSAALSYQHNVQPRFETGSHELYWITGQSLGSLQIGRLVGDRGLLDGIRYGGAPNDLRKGLLGGVEVKIGRINTIGVSVRQEVLVISGCVLANYGVSFSAGGLDIQESMTIQVAMVKKVPTVAR